MCSYERIYASGIFRRFRLSALVALVRWWSRWWSVVALVVCHRFLPVFPIASRWLSVTDCPLHREDGMGISDTFPLKLGLSHTHHNLSHKSDKDGMLEFAKYDRFLSEQLAYFLKRMHEFQDNKGSVLDNTIVLYGSGASTTHRNTNLPTLIAGGSNMGLKHGQYWTGRTRMTNMFLSILRSMGIQEGSFGDSHGTLSNCIFPV